MSDFKDLAKRPLHRWILRTHLKSEDTTTSANEIVWEKQKSSWTPPHSCVPLSIPTTSSQASRSRVGRWWPDADKTSGNPGSREGRWCGGGCRHGCAPGTPDVSAATCHLLRPPLGILQQVTPLHPPTDSSFVEAPMPRTPTSSLGDCGLAREQGSGRHRRGRYTSKIHAKLSDMVSPWQRGSGRWW